MLDSYYCLGHLLTFSSLRIIQRPDQSRANMGAEKWTILSLFQSNEAKTGLKRQDSGVDDAVNQLNSFKGFGTAAEPVVYG